MVWSGDKLLWDYLNIWNKFEKVVYFISFGFGIFRFIRIVLNSFFIVVVVW